jgi:hypothetical protein
MQPTPEQTSSAGICNKLDPRLRGDDGQSRPPLALSLSKGRLVAKAVIQRISGDASAVM